MLVQLSPGAQNYDWGKLGSASKVAQFALGIEIDEEKPYAELWMGTHPKLPSGIVGQTANLRELLHNQPELLGEHIERKFGPGELPFLFKVLSIRKALSIQAHPDKALAKQLYARDSANYPDDNHKPEMALALTDFEGFCGFRPAEEIASFLKEVPEFEELVGDHVSNAFVDAVNSGAEGNELKGALKTLFAAVMNTGENDVARLTDSLLKSAKSQPDKFAGPHGGHALADLVVRLFDQFPNDIGLFCGALMLNFCKLTAGEGMFLCAKDPHAYISGDIIECMAASDNVVRAGFTPKFKDVSTLVEMLTYETAPVRDQKMKPVDFDKAKGGVSHLFDPPIEEFAVVRQCTDDKAEFSALNGASIFIVTEGEGTLDAGDIVDYKPGNVFFVSAGSAFTIKASKPTVSFHAICE